MAVLISRRSLVIDSWRALDGDPGRWLLPTESGLLAELPPGDLIVPLAVWRVRAGDLDGRARRGVRIPAAAGPEAIAADLARLDLVALDIAAATDGRASSAARLLRERYGFRGELRAAGAVVRDQLALLERCGFDSFELPDGADLAAVRAAFFEIGAVYQADAGARFGRRRVAA